jgi:hypothetical protein
VGALWRGRLFRCLLDCSVQIVHGSGGLQQWFIPRGAHMHAHVWLVSPGQHRLGGKLAGVVLQFFHTGDAVRLIPE